MPVLSRSNSGVATNCLVVKGGGCVFPGPVFSHIFRSPMTGVSYLPGQLLVSQAPTNDMPHSEDEALGIIQYPDC